MKTCEFTLILDADELNLADCDKLYEAGCDDGSIITCGGVHMIKFDRQAESLEAAIQSALAHVEHAGFKVPRVEIDPALMPAI